VHRTEALLGGDSIDESEKGRNRTCCVHLRLEGKFVTGTVYANRACAAPSASDSIATISSGIFYVYPWSESIADPEEAAWEWASSVVECMSCLGMQLRGDCANIGEVD
jgi:hypothetical protein